MKILEINESHYPVGGAESYFFKITRALRERGHTVKSLGFGEKNRTIEKEVVIKETKSRYGRYFWRLFPNPRVYRKIHQVVKEFRPDVVHIHNINKYTFSILLAIRGQNVVQTVHDFLLVCPGLWCVYKDTLKVCPGGFGVKCMRHKCIKWRHAFGLIPFFYARNRLLKTIVKHYHAPSKTLKKYLERHGFTPVTFSPLFLDMAKWSPKGEVEEGRLLYVGSLEKQKGVIYLLQAAKLLREEGVKFNFRIVGRGSEEERLKTFMKENGLEDMVTLTGRIPFNELLQEYRKAKFLIVPSIWQENAPVVVSEALAIGLPVIGSRRGGIPNFVKSEETGFLFKTAGSNDLKEKIKKGLRSPKKRYEKLRKRGINFARKTYDHEKHMKALEELFRCATK